MLVQNKTHHEWVFIKSRSELWNCVQYCGDFLFPLQDRLQGMQDRKPWNKVFLFHGDFILALLLSFLIFLLESKLSHQSLRPWQPYPTRKGGGGGQSPSCCSALPCPAPRTQLWGTADFGGDTGVRETGAKSGKHCFIFSPFFPDFFFISG